METNHPSLDLDQKKKVVPAIVGALVSAAASAALTAATEAANNLKSAHPISCVFINDTPFNWEVVKGFGQPIHGVMAVNPGDVVDIFKGAVHQDNNVYRETNFTTWSLNSHSKDGTEIVTVFYCPDLAWYAAFYGGYSHSDTPYAGVSLSDKEWFDAQNAKHKNDSKGKWIRDHIHKIGGKGTNLCQFAPSGIVKEVASADIQVKFQGAKDDTYFRMKFLGDWTPYVPSPIHQDQA